MPAGLRWCDRYVLRVRPAPQPQHRHRTHQVAVHIRWLSAGEPMVSLILHEQACDAVLVIQMPAQHLVWVGQYHLAAGLGWQGAWALPAEPVQRHCIMWNLLLQGHGFAASYNASSSPQIKLPVCSSSSKLMQVVLRSRQSGAELSWLIKKHSAASDTLSSSSIIMAGEDVMLCPFALMYAPLTDCYMCTDMYSIMQHDNQPCIWQVVPGWVFSLT